MAELQRARAMLTEAEARTAEQTDGAPLEIAVAEAEVALARARVREAQAELELTRVRAPADGTVLRIDPRVGEQVSGRTILVLADLDRLKAVAEVEERLAPRVSVGQPASVSLRGGGRSWPARVASVGRTLRVANRAAPDAATGAGGRFVEIDLELIETDGLPRIAGLELFVRIGEP